MDAAKGTVMPDTVTAMNALTKSALLLLLAAAANSPAQEASLAPPADERQLPKRMHSAMKELPRISAGHSGADINGSDHRALQAAVEYVAALGGGTVEIRAGTYEMRDSLHLRPHVTVRGVKDQTVLRKADAVSTPLVRDGDFGEEQITVKDAAGLTIGAGVTVWDKNSGGSHTTVARITGGNGNTFSLDKPLNADCMVSDGATAATVFPVISGCELEGCRLEGLTIDGNRERNPHLNGCRGAGIFLYRGFGTVIQDCTVRNFNGDGISFQQSNDVAVRNCLSEGNASLGLHPGSGSQRPLIEKCTARRNGEDGLFLCWRVRHGVFRDNVLEGNGRFGISIGHKDTDNLLQRNQIRLNEEAGVFFRNESEAMAGHRNRLEANVIENNGVTKEAPGIRVRGETSDLDFTGNIIRDTRPGSERRQTTGILIEEKAGAVKLEDNRIEADKKIDDRRQSKPRAGRPLQEGAAVQLNGQTATLTKLEALPLVENEYSRRFRFDSSDNPKLNELRDRYQLESIVAPGKDEFEKQVLLMDWTHRQFKKFGQPSTKAQGALEILAGIENGHRFFCSQYAQLLVSAAASLGWIDRPLALRRHQGANKNGGSTEHSVTEIWSNQHRKWVMLDPTANMFVAKDGVPLHAWEIRQEWFYHDGKDLVFTVGREQRNYRKADLPIKLGRFEGFGELTVDPDEPDKYGFIGWIPNTDLMDSGFDYGKMFIGKDRLCDGTQWHVRPLPANPATDPYFPLGQAALSLAVENDSIAVSLKTLTPNFKRFELRTDNGEWRETAAGFTWKLKSGLNRLEVRTVNAFGVTGPASLAEMLVEGS
jgi:hypothetical protein